MEKRFAYNPKDQHFFDCPLSHVDAINALGKRKDFDQYIRGIVKDGVLYLRVFYPLPDIDALSYDELIEKSNWLLIDNLADIQKHVKLAYKVNIKQIKLSVTNNYLRGILTNI